MGWNNYRDILGIEMSDSNKFDLAKQNVLNFIQFLDDNGFDYDSVSFFKFCNTVGCTYKERFALNQLKYYFAGLDNLKDLIFSIVVWGNTINPETFSLDRYGETYITGEQVLAFSEGLINNLNLNLELVKYEEKTYLIPKGCKEFDNALIEEPYIWLAKYPKTQENYARLLQDYMDNKYARDLADNCRKLLESFLQEFLENDANLDSNINKLGDYFKERGLTKEFTNMIVSLMRYYKKHNDAEVKHNDRVSNNVIEYLIYQTGLFIRLVIKA